MPIEAASPEHESEERTTALHDNATEHFCLDAPDQEVLVALAPDWVPVLSEAMLGERLKPGAEGAADLMQEVGSQAFGTVQSTLAAEGTELPNVQFEAVDPGETPAPLEGPSWHIPFSIEHEGTSLDGFVLMLTEDSPSEDASGNTFAHRNSPESESTQQTASASSVGDPSAGNPSAGNPSAGNQESEVDVAPAAFEDLGDEDLEGTDQANTFELLAEVDLEVRVELGRRELPLADVLKLTTGSVVELEKMVGEPLSVYANGRLIAEGEAVVIDEQFGVRITNLASQSDRDKAFF
ncbi:MAG: flagellar motor switch protein FliN [Salinibacter sp.]